MSQIDGESGADESGGEEEWRVWREADPISGLMSKAGKRRCERVAFTLSAVQC